MSIQYLKFGSINYLTNGNGDLESITYNSNCNINKMQLTCLKTVVIYFSNLYYKYQQYKIGVDAAEVGNFVVAVTMLEPLAKHHYTQAQILLESIYLVGSETVPRDYAKSFYWCVQANTPLVASIFGYDVQAVNQTCEIDFAKKALYVSLSRLNNEYYRAKFISGINWLKMAYLTGDKATHELFKQCDIKATYVYTPTTKWDIKKFQCICEKFDWGERNRPDCTIGEQINKIESS